MRISPAFIYAVAATTLGGLLTAPVALADQGENTTLNLPSDTSTHAAHAANASGGIVRTIVALLIVCAVIYGLTWVLKKVKSSKETTASGSSLENLATLPLGTNRALHLVRAGGEVVLLGVAEHGVTPIRRFSETEAVELGLLDTDVPQPATLESLAVTGDEPRKPQTIGGLLDGLRAKTVVKR
jgi:flagellar protein FliO/FliZ